MPTEEAARLRGVLFDLDDTVLDHRQLSEAAYRALWQLVRGDQIAIAVTGRAALWGKWLLELWPLAAAVTENGAIAWVKREGRVSIVDRLPPDGRRARWQHLLAISSQLQQAFPWLQPTGDESQRISDIAFDIGEHERVEPKRIQEVVQRARQLGARTSVSSIHLHITLDADDKASGSVRLLREAFGIDEGLALTQFAFIGDSGNDAACFAAFETSIAVSNWRGEFTRPPRYVTSLPMGAGFAESVAQLSAKRERHSLPVP